MLKNPINKGFTLLEILIVIVITGITLTFAVLAFGDFGQSKKIKFSAQQFVNLLDLASQQAILEPAVFGVKINNKGYVFYRLNFEKKLSWQKITRHKVFYPHQFPKLTQIAFKTKFRNNSSEPQIIINSTGNMTPFNLEFSQQSGGKIIQIQANANGTIKTNDFTSK